MAAMTARHRIDGGEEGDPCAESLDSANGERVGRFADGYGETAQTAALETQAEEAEAGGSRRSGVGRLHGYDASADFSELKHIYQPPGVAAVAE